ncbi:MAG: ATP-binding protein [Sphingopyxis sp.]|nr:ATP-binding protein [Sphingopyxis sp.]
MDQLRNPFAPGAGSRPPELAGRAQLIDDIAVAIARIRAGRAAQSIVLYGLRGVGKTVLLNTVRQAAEARGIITVPIESPEDRSLPAMIAPSLRAALLRLDRMAAVGDKAKRALRALAGFVKLKVRFADIEVAVDLEAERGLADSGDLELDLADLVRATGEAARAADTAVVLFIDELQYVREEQLAALIVTLHMANQAGLPVTMVGAGLPQLLGRMGRAKSYAERLFLFRPLGPLDHEALTAAIRIPIEDEGEQITDAAIGLIALQTQGYPYFLQEWGRQCWAVAEVSPIDIDDVQTASALALAQLDASFFRVRFDRLTPTEKRYMRAMASLGPGPHRSADIAAQLGVKVTSAGPTRNALILKGMIYSPDHGDTAFTVPMFDAYLRRVMPEGTI